MLSISAAFLHLVSQFARLWECDASSHRFSSAAAQGGCRTTWPAKATRGRAALRKHFVQNLASAFCHPSRTTCSDLLKSFLEFREVGSSPINPQAAGATPELFIVDL